MESLINDVQWCSQKVLDTPTNSFESHRDHGSKFLREAKISLGYISDGIYQDLGFLGPLVLIVYFQNPFFFEIVTQLQTQLSLQNLGFFNEFKT